MSKKRNPTREIEITIRLHIPEGVSLAKLERLIDEAGDRAKREALESPIGERETESHECQACGYRGTLRNKGRTHLRFHTLFGEVRIKQPRYRCPVCGEDVYPLEKWFNLIPPGPVTPGVYRLAALLGIEEDFEEADRALAESTRGQVCLTAKEVHGLTQRAGQAYLDQQEREVAILLEDPDCYRQVGGKANGLFCVETDGGYVPAREGREGMEGKVAKIWWDYYRRKQGERPVIREKGYVATFQGAEELGKRAPALSIAMGGDGRDQGMATRGWSGMDTESSMGSLLPLGDLPSGLAASARLCLAGGKGDMARPRAPTGVWAALGPMALGRGNRRISGRGSPDSTSSSRGAGGAR